MKSKIASFIMTILMILIISILILLGIFVYQEIYNEDSNQIEEFVSTYNPTSENSVEDTKKITTPQLIKDKTSKIINSSTENNNKTEKEINKIVSYQIALEDATPWLPKPLYADENIELDASQYIFFGDIKSHLHLSIDTSTNSCTGAYLDYQETLNGYYHVVFQIFTKYGLPMNFTTDGRTIF